MTHASLTRTEAERRKEAEVSALAKRDHPVNFYLDFDPKSDKPSKKDIIPALLKLCKNGEITEAMRIINALKDNGIDYPEFTVIEKALGAN